MGMTAPANPGPTLAEEELLIDGEPIFAMAWPGVGETPQAAGVGTGGDPPFAPKAIFRGEGFAEPPAKPITDGPERDSKVSRNASEPQ